MLIETATFMWQFLRVQKPAQATNPKIVVAVRNANHEYCGHFIATIIPEPNRAKKSRWKRRMQAAAQRAVAGSVRFAEWDGGKQTVRRAANRGGPTPQRVRWGEQKSPLGVLAARIGVGGMRIDHSPAGRGHGVPSADVSRAIVT